MNVNNLEVILKLSERCNINCTYCYVFNGADNSFKRHPPILSRDICSQTSKYLRESINNLSIKKLQIDFHGGEPMLVGKSRFAEYCNILRNELAPIVDLSFAIQTNATLIDLEWIDLFSEFRVSPGVSLDGTKILNDKNRIDFQGRGTYDKTVNGLKLLQTAYNEDRINSLGVLCVINPENCAKEIYRHFVHDLRLETMDFLLPDLNHNTIGTRDPLRDGQFLCDLFDCWVEDDNPKVFIRTLNSVMSLLLGGRSKVIGFGQEVPFAISIATDGTVGPDDTLRSCGTDFYATNYNVSNSTLMDFIASKKLRTILEAGKTLPSICESCCWQATCGGGHLIHRYSESDLFSNPSVMCNGLKHLYSHVSAFLINNGMPLKSLKKNLKLTA